jgi:hypothetical protein
MNFVTYTSPSIAGIVKPRPLRWAVLMARLEIQRMLIEFWRGNLSENVHW